MAGIARDDPADRVRDLISRRTMARPIRCITASATGAAMRRGRVRASLFHILITSADCQNPSVAWTAAAALKNLSVVACGQGISRLEVPYRHRLSAVLMLRCGDIAASII
jgi:hypothetical protein